MRKEIKVKKSRQMLCKTLFGFYAFEPRFNLSNCYNIFNIKLMSETLKTTNALNLVLDFVFALNLQLSYLII